MNVHIKSRPIFDLSTQSITNLTKYNCYHTNLVLLHKFNALPDEFKSAIPYSTLSSWSKRDVTQIIGCNSAADFDVNLVKQIISNKKLLLAARALYFLFSTVSKLFRDADNKAELLKLHKTKILETISRVHFSLNRYNL